MSVLLMCYCSVVLMCYHVLFNSASQQVSCAVGSLLGCHNYAVRLGNVPLRLPSWLSGKAAPVPSAAGCCIGPWHLPLLSWWPCVCVWRDGCAWCSLGAAVQGSAVECRAFVLCSPMQCCAVSPSCSNSPSVQSTHRPAGGKNVPRPGLGVKRREGDPTTTTTALTSHNILHSAFPQRIPPAPSK